jgi:argininosuccinate lyase
VFDFKAAVERKDTPGGTAPDAVREQIRAAKDYLDAKAE